MTDTLIRQLSGGFVAVFLILGAFSFGVYGAATLEPYSLTASAAQAAALTITLDEEVLIAKSAIVYDLSSSRVVYQKNAYEQLPLASLTKLMAVETILSAKSPDTPVQISLDNLRTDGDSGFKVGDTVTLGDLISFSLVASSNDAMEAAAGSLGAGFIQRMNQIAKELGLTKTHFFNATGLDISRNTSGAYGSAYDVARLAALFYKNHPDFFELTTRPEVTITQGGKDLTAGATMKPLQNIPGFVAAKTGYTELAGGNLVAVFDLEPGRTVVAAVLGSTREGRFSDVITLIETARAPQLP